MIRRVLQAAITLTVSLGGPAAAQEISANFDFVPGERILFADDFMRDRVGNFPQRLQLFHGNMEVVELRGKRYLRPTSDGAFGVALPEVLPQRFTVEFDLAVPWNGMIVHVGPNPTTREGCCATDQLAHAFVIVSGTEAGVRNAGGEGGSFANPGSVLSLAPEEDVNGKLVRVRVEVDGRYIKVYLNEQRVANIPDADFGRGNKLVFETTASDAEHVTLIGDIVVAAGGRGMYDALMADGRVVTQGILFDVNSDRIRPASAPTLKLIGDMLREHADLRLVVEGHTDNTGAAAANQSLSERRAAAIVSHLVSTFGIDASRLTAHGLGASRPAAANDTPEGRQQNRRVELVRM